ADTGTHPRDGRPMEGHRCARALVAARARRARRGTAARGRAGVVATARLRGGSRGDGAESGDSACRPTSFSAACFSVDSFATQQVVTCDNSNANVIATQTRVRIPLGPPPNLHELTPR